MIPQCLASSLLTTSSSVISCFVTINGKSNKEFIGKVLAKDYRAFFTRTTNKTALLGLLLSLP